MKGFSEYHDHIRSFRSFLILFRTAHPHRPKQLSASLQWLAPRFSFRLQRRVGMRFPLRQNIKHLIGRAYRLDDPVEGFLPVNLDEPVDGFPGVEAEHLHHSPLPIRVAGADGAAEFDVPPDVALVDVGGSVEHGKHQPEAEHQLHVRPQRKPL
ncbi:hypothetical protein MUK42_34463 [Musa troglodytarum]|uniref:Uncharacterized protein n=1 Tax=Musa troglodytarum TaxID=320322 RepID=A0A9E7FQ38_9LILI|nr:hypothetical protein MUK42_34463 [Musa troglodytarum]